jgi:hypothetical protein
MPYRTISSLVRQNLHLEARLEALEEILQRAGLLDDIEIVRRPPPVDPAPIDRVRLRDDLVANQVQDILRRKLGWITDPPPEDFLNVRVLDLIRRYRGGFTDPAPDDLANVRLKDLIQRIPGGGFTDPSPEDISRLTVSELEGQLHKVNTEVVRLKSLERMISGRLEEIKSPKAKRKE